MSAYRHHVSGFFAHRSQAEEVARKLIHSGISPERVQIYDKTSTEPVHQSINSSDKVLKDILVDGAVGAVVGTGLGALVEVGLIAANVTLFVASPLIAPLVLLGWGAGMGGLIGATAGAAEKARPLSDLVHDAIVSGQTVVIAQTKSEEETRIAGEILQAAIGDYSDVV